MKGSTLLLLVVAGGAAVWYVQRSKRWRAVMAPPSSCIDKKVATGMSRVQARQACCVETQVSIGIRRDTADKSCREGQAYLEEKGFA